jgi:MFS superfamily sulfate permease-like transporter
MPIWLRLLLSISTPPKAILLNLHANFGIDLSATDTLFGLVAEADKTETEVLFAELQNPVRQMFGRSGLLDRVRENSVFTTVDDGAQDYLNRHTRPVMGAVPPGSLPIQSLERTARRSFL